MARRRGFFAELEHQRLQRERLERQRLAQVVRAQREHERAVARAQREQRVMQREEKARYVEARTNDAVQMTADVESRVTTLNRILIDGLSRRSAVDLNQL
jgi:restriction system protein